MNWIRRRNGFLLTSGLRLRTSRNSATRRARLRAHSPCWILLAIVAFPAFSFADLIYLKNGKKIEAIKVHEVGDRLVYEIDGRQYSIPISLVDHYGPREPKPASSESGQKAEIPAPITVRIPASATPIPKASQKPVPVNTTKTEPGFEPLPPVLTTNGTLTAGYYEVERENGLRLYEHGPVASVKLDSSGYLLHPRIFNFNLKPQFSFGRQSSEAIFPDGKGGSATATLLSGQPFPLTVSYAYLDRQIITFAPVDRLAGLEAESTQSTFNANWHLRMPHLPQLTADYSHYSDDYSPSEPLVSSFKNRGEVLAAGLEYSLDGFHLLGDARKQQADEDLLNTFDPSQQPYLYRRDAREARGSLDRSFGKWSHMLVSGGRVESRNSVGDRPFDLDYDFAHGTFQLQPSQRVSVTFQTGFNSNLLQYEVQQLLGSAGSGLGSADGGLLLSNASKVNVISGSAQVRVGIAKYLRSDTTLTENQTQTREPTAAITPDSRLQNIESGLFFSRTFGHMQSQAYYSANAGRFEYAGDASHTQGHHGYGSVIVGSLNRMEVTISGQGYTQKTQDFFRLDSNFWGTGLEIAHGFSNDLRIRLGGTYEQNAFTSAGAVNFDAHGRGATLLLSHPLFNLSANYHRRNGLTLQPLLSTIPIGVSKISISNLPGILAVPSLYDRWSSAVSVHPLRNLTAGFLFSDNRQDLSGQLSNAYREWEGTVAYDFRQLTIDFGYTNHDQEFGLDHFRRNRFYFRLIRQFHLF